MNLNLERIAPKSGRKCISLVDFPAIIVDHYHCATMKAPTAHIQLNVVAINFIGNKLNVNIEAGDKVKLYREFDEKSWYLNWLPNSNSEPAYSLYNHGNKIYFQSKHHFDKGLQQGIYRIENPVINQNDKSTWFPITFIKNHHDVY